MNRVIVGVVAAVVIIAAIILYATSDEGPATVPVSEQPQTETPVREQMPTRTIRVPVTLTAQLFNPSNVSANVGDTVILAILSADSDHIVYAPLQKITESIGELETKEITLPVTAATDFVVVCSDKCDQGVMFTVDVQ